MTTNKSLRDRFHYLTNQIGGISVHSQSFSIICKDYPDKIDSSTKNELSRVLNEIESYYEKAIESLDSTSRMLDKTIAAKDWANIKNSIKNDLKDIYALLTVVKDMGKKVSNSNLKTDIVNVAKEIGKFHEICEPMCQLIDNFKDKLLSFGIYDNVHEET